MTIALDRFAALRRLVQAHGGTAAGRRRGDPHGHGLHAGRRVRPARHADRHRPRPRRRRLARLSPRQSRSPGGALEVADHCSSFGESTVNHQFFFSSVSRERNQGLRPWNESTFSKVRGFLGASLIRDRLGVSTIIARRLFFQGLFQDGDFLSFHNAVFGP